MIDKISYEDMHTISVELSKEAGIIAELEKGRNIQEIADFAATVEGYSKFLENTIEIHKDADKALQELRESA